MKYTSLGRTGLQVSRFCLGTMNFGPQTSETDSFTIMDQALEQGINFFDTANVSGIFTANGDTSHLHLGLTEEIIGAGWRRMDGATRSSWRPRSLLRWARA